MLCYDSGRRNAIEHFQLILSAQLNLTVVPGGCNNEYPVFANTRMLTARLNQQQQDEMKIYYPIPSNKISEYVQGIFVIENNWVTSPFLLPLFANGTPTLLFQTTKAQIKNSSNYLTLFGQTISPQTLIIKDNFILIAYFLKPYSLLPLFGISAQELTDNPIDLNLFSKNLYLQEQVLNASTISEILYLIDSFLFSLMKNNKSDGRVIKYATEKISNNPGKEILRKVQNDLSVTERTFQRLFEKNIGISPKLFRKISQFSKAFQQLNGKNFQTLSDIAFGNDYADQSHYNRVFKEFTNLTPTEYLGLTMPS